MAAIHDQHCNNTALQHFQNIVENSKKHQQVCLILTGTVQTHNEIDITNPTSLLRLQEIAKTHQIVIGNFTKTLGNQIDAAARQAPNKPIKDLVIWAHGFPHGISTNDMNQDWYTNPEEADFKKLAPDCTIHLIACQTGGENTLCPNEDPIALKIAKVSKRAVYAPTTNINAGTTFFIHGSDGNLEMIDPVRNSVQKIEVITIQAQKPYKKPNYTPTDSKSFEILKNNLANRQDPLAILAQGRLRIKTAEAFVKNRENNLISRASKMLHEANTLLKKVPIDSYCHAEAVYLIERAGRLLNQPELEKPEEQKTDAEP